MKKAVKWLALCIFAAAFVWFGTVTADRQALNENVIRFHVVANSDSGEDQAVKLLVRSAVMEHLEPELAGMADADEARAYLRSHLAEVEQTANRVLAENGFSERAAVTLEKEAFSTREYDTFTLPAGVYDALRITIGEGQGRNWWCVVFPQLCIPATSEDFTDTAAGAGFSDSLTGALEQEYEVRFFFLDCLGWLENFFFGS